MKLKLSYSLLYNKLLEENKLVGVAYYPSKRKGFQFLLIVKSGIKIDFVKYEFVSYKELFNISKKDKFVILAKQMIDIIDNLNKIYIPVRNIKGYSYEKTDNGFKTYLKVKNNNGNIQNILISRSEKILENNKNFNLLMYHVELEKEGFMLKNQECKEDSNNQFKTLKLGINNK